MSDNDPPTRESGTETKLRFLAEIRQSPKRIRTAGTLLAQESEVVEFLRVSMEDLNPSSARDYLEMVCEALGDEGLLVLLKRLDSSTTIREEKRWLPWFLYWTPKLQKRVSPSVWAELLRLREKHQMFE